MRKDHKENTVGPWAIRKLDALEAYLKFYSIALSRQNFTRVYIDAFAGSCISKVRGSDAIVEASPLFDETEDVQGQENFILGSPVRALSIANGFHKHYFFDLDETRAQTLRQLGDTFGHDGLTVKVGDSNPLIRDLAKSLHSKKVRGVAFLDPYGPHLEWATIEALAETGNFEVIINFPAAMAINRLITKSGKVPEKWEGLLNKCFGTTDWRTVAYTVEKDLFGQEVVSKQGGVSERLLDLYMKRLNAIFPFMATPRLIRNTKGIPLYYLIWAGPNKLGLQGADHILSQGEKVPKRV